MPETEKKVQPVRVRYLCDKCRIGFMEFTGATFLLSVPLYEHKCDFKDCGYQKNFYEKYPYIKYVEDKSV
jgi:hypothetical protein